MYIHDTIEHDFLVKVYRGKWNRRTRLIRQIAQKIGIFRREERERGLRFIYFSLEIDFYFRRLRKKQISELLKVLVPSTVGLSCLSSRNFPKTGRRERSFSVPPTCPQNDTRVWHDPREPSILENDNQSLDGVAHRLIGSQDCLKLILFHEREGEDSPFPSKKISLSRPPLVRRSIISSRFFGKIDDRRDFFFCCNSFLVVSKKESKKALGKRSFDVAN